MGWLKCNIFLLLPFILTVFIFSFAVCLPSDAVSGLSTDSKEFSSEFINTLDPEEKDWLREHPEISMGIMNAWRPLNFVDDHGNPCGIGVDYIHAVNQRLGRDIKLVPGAFKENLSAVKEKRLDALMDVTPKPDRAEYLNFTQPYMDIPHVIVSRAGAPKYRDEDDLKGKTLALETGFGNVRHFREKYPEVTVVEYPDTAACLLAVSVGEADAYAGNRAVVLSLIGSELLPNLQVQGQLRKKGSVLAIGVRKDWELLASILDKALADLSVREINEIHQRWTGIVPDNTKRLQIPLTPDERAWLSEHPNIKIGINESWAPFVYRKSDGRLAGYDVDFLSRINELTGADIQLVAGQWKDIVEQAQRGEIDGLAESAVVKSRREHFLFTDPYNTFEYAAATVPEKAVGINSASDLKGKRIAHLKGNIWTGKIMDSIGGVQEIEATSEEEAFRFVLQDKADFALIPVYEYASLHEIFHQSFMFAYIFINEDFILKTVYSIRKDWPELVSVINKALLNIGRSERQALFEKWVPMGTVPAESALPLQGRFNIAEYLLKSIGALGAGIAVVIFIAWLLKGRPGQLSIRDSLLLIAYVYAALIIASSAFVVLLIRNHEHGDLVNERKIESLNLAWELKQSSDDLTRLVRTYVVTGDPKYEEYFRTIMAIRDGDQAHPKDFSPFYWDYVTAGSIEQKQDGDIYSIEEKMSALGLPEVEIAELRKAKEESDDLINLENTAMNAVKGLFRDKDGLFTIHRTPDMEMARNLVHGEKYHKAKARIMKSIEQFHILLNTRMAYETEQLHRKNEAIALAITIVVAITIGFSIYVFFLMRRRIVTPLVVLESAARNIEKGDYSQRIEIVGNDEIGALAATFNSMSHSIKENTSRLNAIIESITDGILVVDLQRKVTTYNMRFLEIWNLDPDLPETADDTMLLDAVLAGIKNPDSFLERVRYLYANPEEDAFDTILMLNDHVLERYSMPQRLGDQVVGRVWCFRDVTDRQRAEQALVDSEGKLQAMSAAIHDGLIMIDHEARVMFWNKAAETIFGYTADEITGRNLHSVIAPEKYREDARKGIENFCRDGLGPVVGQLIEIEALHRNGSVFPVEVGVSAFSMNGRWYAVATVRDITERKKNEFELRKLSMAVEQSPASVVITDAEGTIEYVNPYFSKLTGYSAEEAVGNNPRILKSGIHSSDFYKELWATILSGAVWHGELCNRKKSGAHYWESVSIAPAKDNQGNITHFIAIKEDITERREMEIALQKSQERLVDAAKISNMGYFELDFSTMIFSIDAFLWNLLGTSIEDEGGILSRSMFI